MIKTAEGVKIYFVTIPEHKFLHIKHYESNGYWDFWRKQDEIPGCDCDTICGLLDSIKGNLDEVGHIMARLNEEACERPPEAYGIRLPADYKGDATPQMLLIDVPEGEYIVFEHGPFDYEQENCSVESKLIAAMNDFDYSDTDHCLDEASGRVYYFYHKPEQYWKYIKPVKKN